MRELHKREKSQQQLLEARTICRRDGLRIYSPLLAMVGFLALTLLGCGGGISSTPPANVVVSVAPGSASLFLGQPQQFQATVTDTTNTSVTWNVNGVDGGNITVGTISTSGLYTAPASMPSPTSVTVTAISQADSQASSSATVTLKDDIVVKVSPDTANVQTSAAQLFTANISASGSPATGVTWSVNGIAGGNSGVGAIAANGADAAIYTAPIAPPSPANVTVTATSVADPTRSGSAAVKIACSASNSISPSATNVSLGQTQTFTASFCLPSGTTIAWDVNGIAGGSASIGTISGAGTALYTAPADLPVSSTVTIHATAGAATASATVTIASSVSVSISPPSATISLGQRSSFSATATTCATALNPVDVQSAGTYTIQVQNPGSPGALSNPVPFVVVPFDVSVDTISLSSAVPVATGKNIIVTEPTTAASAAPINVDFVGYFTSGNTCGMQGSPLSATRPSSGSTTVSICVHGNGLDPTFSYAFTGPNGGDIGLTASAVTGLFPGVIELDLQISSATLPGARTLFITTLNNDRAVASGILEVN